MHSNAHALGATDVTEGFKGFLLAESSIIKNLPPENLGKRASDVFVVLASCCTTSVAITTLGEKSNYFYSEVVVLARAFLERIINFCYLQVCSDDEYERFIAHTVQKSYRKLDRTVSVGDCSVGLKYMGDVDIESNPGLKKSLQEFTSKSGKEKTHWTSVNLLNRIATLKELADINIGFFLTTVLSIYEDASESLHGTLYGCSFHTWAYEAGVNHRNPKELEKNTQKHLALLYMALGVLFHETLIILSKKNSMEDAKKASKANLKTATELLASALKK